jgi:hypothetical protein
VFALVGVDFLLDDDPLFFWLGGSYFYFIWQGFIISSFCDIFIFKKNSLKHIFITYQQSISLKSFAN